ncbi:MAG: cytochrome c-type biogenesis protein CcmH [Thermoanaerobaculia bacterium]
MIAAFLFLLSVTTAAPQGTPLSGAALDAKTTEVASLLRCPVCQGMSIADSPSEMAVNMKHQVNAMLAQGYTRDQILDYFETSYGQFVLLKPKFRGVNTLVWILPVLSIAIGFIIVMQRLLPAKPGEGGPKPDDGPVASEENVPPPPIVQGSRKYQPIFIALPAALLALGAWYLVQPKQTPEPPPQQAEPVVAVDPVHRLEETVQQFPDNLPARVELAKLYFDRNNLMGVFEQTQYVLARTPDDPRALTYQAFVRIGMGQRDNAAKLLTRATAVDPSLTDAWVGIAWIKTQEGLPVEAQAAIAEAARRHPEDAARLRNLYADMQQRAQ